MLQPCFAQLAGGTLLVPDTPPLKFSLSIRLANASLSYALDVKQGSFIKGLNLTLSGQNLALFTKYSGLDPEVNVDKSRNGVPSRGFDYTATPRARVVTFGINARF